MSKNQGVLSDLVEAIQQTSRSIQFSDSGTMDAQGLTFEIEGVGDVRLPLRPKRVREILASANTAPYGKGSQTIIDRSVRDSLEIKGSKIKLPESWDAAVQSAARVAAERLGLPAERVQAKLYKLLIYQKGGFFLPHRDSEKRKGMVGSLVVMLPSPFGGGELVVQHGDAKKSFGFASAAGGKTAEYVAFYADCLHEVRRVTKGVRVCLAYNLILKPERKRASGVETSGADDVLAAAISSWTRARPGEPMVIALEHQYTAQGLKPDLMKGADRLSAQHVIQAAKAAECHVYFGQVSRHLLQFADDGSFERGRYWRPRRVDVSDLQVGETYEDEVIVEGWKDAQGKRVTMNALPLDGSMLVSTTPFEEWKPTSEDYEGYTGNAGNTLDRWYHKSALVLWAKSQHFDVLVQMGLMPAVGAFLQMRQEVARKSAGDAEPARSDCELLARAIIKAWPDRLYRYQSLEKDDQPWLITFAAELPLLGDSGLMRDFLQKIAERDWRLNIDKLVMAGCRQLGADAMAPLLSEYLTKTPPPSSYRRAPLAGLPIRDAQWLCKLASDRKQGGMSAGQLSQLCRLAAKRLSEYLTSQPEYYLRKGNYDDVLASLLQAALASGDEKCFESLLGLKRGRTELFDIRVFDVQTCSNLVKWAKKRYDERPAVLQKWTAEIRGFLEEATKQLPPPPGDFARPSKITCRCCACRELSNFLADPLQESFDLRARKDELEHLQSQIKKFQLDANAKLDRHTRPFTLKLTKTTNSHARSVKQYHADVKLLNSLP